MRQVTQITLPQRTIFFKPSSDDWNPTYPDGTVKVAGYWYNDGMRRVCVWGQDDKGLELNTYNTEKADQLLKQLSCAGLITIQMLLELGFVWG